jgi:hypothetical protein
MFWRYGQPNFKVVVCPKCDSVYQLHGNEVKKKLASSVNEYLWNGYKKGYLDEDDFQDHYW